MEMFCQVVLCDVARWEEARTRYIAGGKLCRPGRGFSVGVVIMLCNCRSMSMSRATTPQFLETGVRHLAAFECQVSKLPSDCDLVIHCAGAVKDSAL